MTKKHLNTEQLAILDRLTISFDRDRLLALAERQIDEQTLSEDELLTFLIIVNALYRDGNPLISDSEYDFTFLAELKRRNPSHPFLKNIEPEPALGEKTARLPVRMLSTDKAYDFPSIIRWGKRIRLAAEKRGIAFDTLIFKATPKLDGYAAYDDGHVLYTRGDGRRGTDISRVFARGLSVAPGGKRGMGAGEIVVSKKYFAQHLASHFDNSRNFQASLIKEKELEVHAAKAIEQKAAVFYPFELLPKWQGSWEEMENEAKFTIIIDSLWSLVDFDIDGVVLEIIHKQLRQSMGATRHHHRWQIAYKQNTDSAQVEILRVIPQTSRSGRITPVTEVEPTRLSGALIKRATAHHYKMVKDNGIGPGTIIELSRSGEVIPKIERIIQPSKPEIPDKCPSCGEELIWDNDFLRCINNMNCPAQISHSLEHFFKTLGNVDGFGPRTASRLFEHGIRTIEEIYQLSSDDFEAFGFGPKQSQNLLAQLLRSKTEQIEDWRFLAAFGVYRMGLGNCEKLLQHYPLKKVLQLTIEQIIKIKGFKEKTAAAIVKGMKKIQPVFQTMFQLGFNLQTSPLSAEISATLNTNPLSGKLLVFTGTMEKGNRNEMKKQAKELGAKVGNSVTGKTDYLVTGQKVGESKLQKAAAKGVTVLTEKEYLHLIQGQE